MRCKILQTGQTGVMSERVKFKDVVNFILIAICIKTKKKCLNLILKNDYLAI